MPLRKLRKLTPRESRPTARQLAELVKECVESGVSVEIDGLGVFRCGKDGRYMLTQPNRMKVFLAYVNEDLELAKKLHDELLERGYDVWLDYVKLLPGQNWPRAVEHAIGASDYFVAMFSSRSVRKPGSFQSELRYALDCARRVPLDDEFIVPVRLENCKMPTRIQRAIQYVDFFPSWEDGLQQLIRSLKPKV